MFLCHVVIRKLSLILELRRSGESHRTGASTRLASKAQKISRGGSQTRWCANAASRCLMGTVPPLLLPVRLVPISLNETIDCGATFHGYRTSQSGS